MPCTITFPAFWGVICARSRGRLPSEFRHVRICHSNPPVTRRALLAREVRRSHRDRSREVANFAHHLWLHEEPRAAHPAQASRHEPRPGARKSARARNDDQSLGVPTSRQTGMPSSAHTRAISAFNSPTSDCSLATFAFSAATSDTATPLSSIAAAGVPAASSCDGAPDSR